MYYMIQVLCYIILCMSGTLLIYKKPFVPHSLSLDRFRLKVSPPFVNFSKVCDCKISKICDISFQSFRYEKIRVCDKDSLPFNKIFRYLSVHPPRPIHNFTQLFFILVTINIVILPSRKVLHFDNTYLVSAAQIYKYQSYLRTVKQLIKK